MQTSHQNEQSFHSEEILLESFKNGDREAFYSIYQQFVRPLTYFTVNIINSPTDAEDIVANAFGKLYHQRVQMKSLDHVKRWLYIIVRNESIDYLRLRTRRRETQENLTYLDTGVEVQAETERIKSLLLQDVLQEIEKLPQQRRTILRLYFFEQKETREIANLLNISPQTVLNHKTKALDALRKSSLKVKWLREGVPIFMFVIGIDLINNF
jgi:RNA polymerase sigma-70 factor (family 1)